jgi:hypothetical protein
MRLARAVGRNVRRGGDDDVGHVALGQLGREDIAIAGNQLDQLARTVTKGVAPRWTFSQDRINKFRNGSGPETQISESFRK